MIDSSIKGSRLKKNKEKRLMASKVYSRKMKPSTRDKMKKKTETKVMEKKRKKKMFQ